MGWNLSFCKSFTFENSNPKMYLLKTWKLISNKAEILPVVGNLSPSLFSVGTVVFTCPNVLEYFGQMMRKIQPQISFVVSIIHWWSIMFFDFCLGFAIKRVNCNCSKFLIFYISVCLKDYLNTGLKWVISIIPGALW